MKKQTKCSTAAVSHQTLSIKTPSRPKFTFSHEQQRADWSWWKTDQLFCPFAHFCVSPPHNNLNICFMRIHLMGQTSVGIAG